MAYLLIRIAQLFFLKKRTKKRSKRITAKRITAKRITAKRITAKRITAKRITSKRITAKRTKIFVVKNIKTFTKCFYEIYLIIFLVLFF